jgi:hypothetical protein
MPYAYREDAYTFAVEASSENLRKLAGSRLPVQVAGDSIRAGMSAKGELEKAIFAGRKGLRLVQFDSLDEAILSWDTIEDGPQNIDACRGCRQSASCVLSGGPAQIMSNADLWDRCGLFGEISVVASGIDLWFMGKSFEYDKNTAFANAHSVAERLGFELTRNSLLFRDVDDWEWNETLHVEKNGESDDAGFTDRFLRADKHGPGSIKLFNWGDRGERSYRAYKRAQGVAAGKKNKVTNAFKKAECSGCAYTCKPMSNWLVRSVADKPEDRQRETQWGGPTHSSPCRDAFEPMSPTVIRAKRCAVRQSELEAEFDGSPTQMASMVASLIAGKTYDEPNIPRRRKEAIVFGQDWEAGGEGWKHSGGQILVRSRQPPFDWMGGCLSIEEACDKFFMSRKEMEEQVLALGDRLPLTFWALKRLGLSCSNGEADLYNHTTKFCRNDILSIELNIGTLERPYVTPEIVIRSDDKSSVVGRFKGASRISIDDRPRYQTTYAYPFFEDIQRQTAQTFGSGR